MISKRTDLVFWIFLILYVLIWTLVITLSRHSIDTSGDVLENYAWGRHWELGYFKHPPFVAWLVASWFKIFPHQNLFYILLSQLNIAVCFIVAFKISKEYLTKELALLSAIMLEFIPYFSFLDMKINPNSLLMSELSLVALFTYKSVTNNRLVYWILLGISCAIAVLTKYTAVVMLASLFILLIITKEGRNSFRNSGIYISVIIFIILISPHIFWLYDYDFLPMQYASKHIKEGFTHRLKTFYTAIFFISSSLIPFFILYFITGIRKFKFNIECNFKSLFPLFITVVPIFLMIFFAFALNSEVSSRWIKPFLCFMPLLIIIFNASSLTRLNLLKTIKIVWGYILIIPLTYLILCALFMNLSKKYSAPLQEVAQQLQQEWDKEFSSPLRYVTGDYVYANAVGFYAYDYPFSLLNFNYQISPWVKESDVKKHGIAIICTKNDETCITKAHTIWHDLKFSEFDIVPKRNMFNLRGGGTYKYSFIAPSGDS